MQLHIQIRRLTTTSTISPCAHKNILNHKCTNFSNEIECKFKLKVDLGLPCRSSSEAHNNVAQIKIAKKKKRRKEMPDKHSTKNFNLLWKLEKPRLLETSIDCLVRNSSSF